MNYSNLFLINLDQEIEGFRDFIGAWLYRDEAVTFLVDPGPASSIDRLKSALDKMGVDEIDYILLTHIHIDHAGGTGKLLGYFPDAEIVCHPRGIKHMIDPVKLWEGSLKVLGDVARAYGEIVPVPRDSICFRETIETGSDVIEAIETPGHAVHHLSYLFNECLFAGEAAGVQQLLPNKIYTRPGTPPRFDLEIWLASLKRVIVERPNPDKPEIGNIKIENLKVKLRRLYNAMISQEIWVGATHSRPCWAGINPAPTNSKNQRS
jgi:Zn-dependent hydrolases, including glyoxylases